MSHNNGRGVLVSADRPSVILDLKKVEAAMDASCGHECPAFRQWTTQWKAMREEFTRLQKDVRILKEKAGAS